MAANFTWSIDGMRTLQSPQSDYVVEVVWTVVGSDGPHVVSCSNTQTLNVVASETFVPYADLTEAIVLGWVQSALGASGVAGAEAQAQGYIDRQMNPPVEMPQNTPLPWAQE
jgi:hypothetical protein